MMEALPKPPADARMSLLTWVYLGWFRPLEVCKSARGFYIGATDEGEPLARDSQEYWPTREEAEHAFLTGAWTQREDA